MVINQTRTSKLLIDWTELMEMKYAGGEDETGEELQVPRSVWQLHC